MSASAPSFLFNAWAGGFAGHSQGSTGTNGISVSTTVNTSAGGSTSIVAPPMATIASIHLTRDNGTSGSDFVTSIPLQGVFGTTDAPLAPGEFVEVSLDNGLSWAVANSAPGSTVWTMSTTLTGSGTLQVRVSNADAPGTALSQAYVLDTLMPSLAISAEPGTLKSGETATITFSFDEDPGATFIHAYVVVSGGTLGAISGTGLTRTADFTPAADTNDGSARITVPITSYFDAAGNPGLGATLAIAYDTLAPAAPSTPNLAAGSDTGTSASDNVTSDTTPTVTGTAEAGATVYLYATDGVTELGSTIAGVDGSWSITSAALADGTHALTVRAQDAAGNTSAPSAPVTVTIDTAVAASSTPNLHSASDTGASDSDDVTDDATPTFTGTAEIGSLVQLFDANDNLLGEAIAVDGTWSITSIPLAEGTHVVSARVTDLAGNVSPPSPGLSIVVDLSAPLTAVTGASFSRDTGRSDTDFITRKESQVISGTLDATLAAGESVQVSLDNGLTWDAAIVGPDGASWSHAATLSGSGTLLVRVMDILDRAGVAWSQDYVLDTTAPDPLRAPVLAVESDRGVSGSDRITNDMTPTVTGTAEAGARVRLYDTDGTLLGAQTADADGNWSITSSQLAAGTHQLTVTSKDLAGNLGAPSLPLEITIDRDRPTVGSVSASNASGLYKAGEVIAIKVRFSEVVVVDGDPQLLLATGTGGTAATYAGGSGGKVLTFHYTVQPGDRAADLDYRGVGALRLDNGSITDLAGNPLVRALPEPGTAGSLGHARDIVIDGIAPALVNARVDGDVLTLRFRETLDGDHLPRVADFTVHAGDDTVGIRGVSYDDATNSIVLQLKGSALPGATMSVSYANTPGDQLRAIQDLAGNDVGSFDVALRSVAGTASVSDVQLVGVAPEAAYGF
jgi:hypothetical protein